MTSRLLTVILIGSMSVAVLLVAVLAFAADAAPR
jgi:hypothetical protein